MPVIYLTADERKMLAVVPENLRGKYEVKDESGVFEDTEESFRRRARAMNVKSPRLKSLQRRLSVIGVDLDLENVTSKLNFEAAGLDDLLELLFVIGPEGIGFIIADLLMSAKQTDDIASAAAYSMVRHSLLATAPAAIAS